MNRVGSGIISLILIHALFLTTAFGAVSKETKRECRRYKSALHAMLESVNDLDRGSRFYTSVSQIEKITALLDKTVRNQKRYRSAAKDFDTFLKLRAFKVKSEGLEPLIKMRRELKYGIGDRYNTKLYRYLRAFKRLLIFSKENLKAIKKGNQQLRRLYDRYYLDYKKEYSLFTKASKSYGKFIKRYYKRYDILDDVVPMPDRLFDNSIWNLNKVRFFGK